jgi:hypothetical protein
MDYTQSKIYRVLVGGSYYYGSTTVPLDERLCSHKYMSKKHPNMKLYKKALELGLDSMTIELVENYPCNSNKELLQRENTYINLSDPLCLNMRPAYQTSDEKKQKEKEQNKKYRLEHLEHLRKKNKEYKSTRPPLTDEERELRRTYQREYMRKRRAVSTKILCTNIVECLQ